MALFYPPFIEWEVTPNCNHNCIHCYNYWRSDKDQSAAIEFERAVNAKYYNKMAKRLIASKPVSVAITGGEPLLVFEKIREAIDMLLQAGINVSLNSNAALLDNEMIDFFAARSVDFFVSLPCADPGVCDSITGIKGSFEKITASIRKMQDAGINVAINMVVSEINYPFVYSTAEYVKNVLGQGSFCATRACLPANAKETFKDKILTKDHFLEMMNTLIKIEDELSIKVDSARAYSLCALKDSSVIRSFGTRRQCSGGKLSFVVSSNGDIKACAMDSVSYGNIFSVDFRDAIEKMSFWQSIEYLPEECKRCKYVNQCGGGCRIDALTTYGDFSKLDPLSDPDAIDNIVLPRIKTLVKDTDIFKLHDNLRVVAENGCIRVSNGIKYEFVTQEAFEVMRNLRTFNIETASNAFGIDCDTTQLIFDALFAAEIIVLAT